MADLKPSDTLKPSGSAEMFAHVKTSGESKYYTINQLGYNVEVIAPNNISASTHNMTLWVEYNGMTSNTLTVSQKLSDYVFTANKLEINVPYTAVENIIIRIESVKNNEYVSYKMTNNPTWVNNAKYSTDDVGQFFKFNVAKNEEITNRNGEIKLIQNESGIEINIKINQEAKEEYNIAVEPVRYTFPASGETHLFKITSTLNGENVEWTFSDDTDKFYEITQDLTKNILLIHCSQNLTSDSKDGIIQIKNAGATTKLRIHQYPNSTV